MLHSSEIQPLESFRKQHFVLHLARSLAVAHEDLGGSSPPIHVKQRQPAPSRGETLSTTPVPVSPRVAGPLPSARAHEFVLYTWETTFHSRQHVDLSASDVQALREELAEHGYRAAPCMTSSMRLVPTWKLLYWDWDNDKWWKNGKDIIWYYDHMVECCCIARAKKCGLKTCHHLSSVAAINPRSIIYHHCDVFSSPEMALQTSAV